MKKLSIITLVCVLMSSSFMGQSECRMLFFDEFDDNKFNWAIKEEKLLSYCMENGYYYIECFKRRRAIMTLQHLKVDENKDFEIETSIRNESSGKKTGYGILFGFSDTDNHYGFLINYKGEFTFFERKNGKIESIIKQKESEYLRKGTEISNTLLIKKEGEDLKLYANDSIVAVTPFKSFHGTGIGFYVQRKQRIAVDYFRVLYSMDRGDGIPLR